MTQWKTIFKGQVGGRSIVAATHVEGGFRVSTSSITDYPGELSASESGTLIMTPVALGSPIDIEAETLLVLREELIASEFSREESEKIVSKFRV